MHLLRAPTHKNINYATHVTYPIHRSESNNSKPIIHGPCIHYIRSPRTLHSLYLVSPDPTFTISSLHRPYIHYIWSPRTLHSLYLVSLDPAFTISGLPGPCIHYIRCRRTLHSLYLVSPDPAFTISGL
ncbi:unnamed protein product, partial [Staurois parvus]